MLCECCESVVRVLCECFVIGYDGFFMSPIKFLKKKNFLAELRKSELFFLEKFDRRFVILLQTLTNTYNHLQPLTTTHKHSQHLLRDGYGEHVTLEHGGEGRSDVRHH